MPITAPKLLEKRSKQLLVMPVYTSVGDGPIISIRVLYKPVENKNEDLWSSIIGIREKHSCSHAVSLYQKEEQSQIIIFFTFSFIALQQQKQRLRKSPLFQHTLSSAKDIMY